MDAALIAQNEHERRAAFVSRQLLDTPDSSEYEAFARLAAEVVQCDIAAIALLDEHRLRFKGRIGFERPDALREDAPNAYVVAHGRPLVVQDASADDRFRGAALVAGEPHLRFYAGIPLTGADGFTFGALFVGDRQPRDISPSQLSALEEIARTLMSVLASRQRLFGLLDVAHIDVFAIDPSTNTIVFATEGTCSRLQYAPGELWGKPIAQVMPSLTPAQLLHDRECALRGESRVRDIELARADGTRHPAALRVSAANDAGTERLLLVATDQTQHKARERDLQVLLRAMNVAGEVILVYRVDASDDLALTYMNDAYVERSGYSREEAIGQSLAALRKTMPDDEGMRILRSAIREGKPANAEIVSYRKNGSSYWNHVTIQPIHSDAGTVTHWICVERDITEDVNRTAALAEEHDRLLALTRAARRLFTALDTRELIETIRDVVRELIPAHARVLAVNNGQAIEVQQFGPTDWSASFRDDLIVKSVQYQMRVINDEQDRAVGYTGRFGESSYVLELRSRASTLLRSTDLFVFDLIVEYFAVAARNVHLYGELDERRCAVLELSQTKSDLIAMLAHDFRGPLTTIVGYADLTGEVGDVNAEQRDFLDTIKSSALQLSELATDTLTLSRLERNEVTLHLGDVDIETLLRDVVAQYANRRQIALEVHGDARITGDDDRLRQVFANLIDNAIKYSPSGASPKVCVDGGGEVVTVTVADRGIGIPAGEVSRVFDRFSRATNARKLHISGTGFGLFLTKQLVQLHGGTISIESTEGVGTTFTVALPRRVDRRAAPRTVVVLDPERDRSFLAYALREAGYRVITVGSLDEVLSVADALAVDVLVLASAEEDLHMPQAAQYRAFSRERNVPIIAVANEPSSRLGAAVTLPRPVLIGDVVSALEALLEPKA